MKQISAARGHVVSAIAALQASLSSDEPDELATAYANAGDGVMRAIKAADSVFKGFAPDVQRQATKLATREA